MLAPAPPVLALPTNRARAAGRTYAGASVSIELGAPLRLALGALGDDAGCTPFVTMLAAFATLLYRYTGETDLCIGTPGIPLPLRCDLSDDPTFAGLLARLGAIVPEACEHRESPLGRAVETALPAGGNSVDPLCSVTFALGDVPRTDAGTAAQTDIDVVAIPHPAGFTLRWEYNRELFDRETIAAMAEHYRCCSKPSPTSGSAASPACR